MMIRFFSFLAAGLFLLGCNSTRNLEASEAYEIRILDTMVVTAYPTFDDSGSGPKGLPEYRASATREFDLLHTRLELSFDWENETVLGKALLSVTPYFHPSDHIILDAKGFEFEQIALEPSGQPLKFDYDGQQVFVRLDREYQRTDTLQIGITYKASPSESGGSLAITSDKGLFFINPRGEDPNKPMQIWTQGETENNSRWFPTIDKPNERCTQEMFVRVDKKFSTLSNGVLVSSVENTDGTRTDYWKMDQPHAPYLFMLAIGEYAVVEDQWREVPLQYYVEPEFKDHAKAIFPHTPEMLEFFSGVLGYPYPWPKYSQVVVRDFVSGAMENTTAVIFGEFMNGKERELVDILTNEKIVAHEMFHHWFGDLVTCESWSNLTLNEGFANYSEYLWLEHKYGKEEADYHLLAEWEDYVYESQTNAHPLIHFHYSDREDMFDRHSYNKGGMVLHMLRDYLGDEAFFAGLNRYLSQHAYSDVEAHELRIAMEDVCGQDLNWFFDQWFFQEGHPKLDIEYSYDERGRQMVVRLKQTQGEAGMPPVFQFPTSVRFLFPDGSVQEEDCWVREMEHEFRFPVPQKPELVWFDPDRTLLCERKENKTTDEYLTQYYRSANVRDRLEALQQIPYDHPRFEQLLVDVLDDSYWALRMFALDNLDENPAYLPKIARLAQQDPRAQVRSTACFLLGQSGGNRYLSELETVIEKDISMHVVAAALDALSILDSERALDRAETLEPEAEGSLLDVIGEIYLNANDISKLDFFRKQIEVSDEYSSIYYMMGYSKLARLGSWSQMEEPAELFYQIASNPSGPLMKRFAAMRGLNDIHVELKRRAGETRDVALREKIQSADKKVVEKIEAVKAAETDQELKEIFRSYPDPRAK